MRTAGWMNVKELIRMSISVLTWKIVHMSKPDRLAQHVGVDNEWKIQTPEPRLQFSRNCLRWRAGETWNNLPLECRQETSIAKLKKMTKLHILQERNWDTGD